MNISVWSHFWVLKFKTLYLTSKDLETWELHLSDYLCPLFCWWPGEGGVLGPSCSDQSGQAGLRSEQPGWGSRVCTMCATPRTRCYSANDAHVATFHFSPPPVPLQHKHKLRIITVHFEMSSLYRVHSLTLCHITNCEDYKVTFYLFRSTLLYTTNCLGLN